MKKTSYLLILCILVFYTGCKKESPTNSLSDTEFMKFISNDDFRRSIIRIDSLAKNENYSDHKTGLLYYEKGRILGHLEKDIEAISSLEKALPLFKKENNKQFIAKTSMLLGDSNGFLSNKEIALEHIQLALEIFKELKDKEGEAKALNSLAHIEFQFGNSGKSIEYVKQAATIQLALDNKDDLAASYNNIGYVLEQSDAYNEATAYYKKAIVLNEEVDRLNSDPLRNLGYIHFIKGRFENCKTLYEKALRIEERSGKLSIQKTIYDMLVEVSIKQEIFKNSFQYITRRDSINELLLKLENEEKIKLIENQYDLITKEKELQQVEDNNSKNKLLFAILTGLLLFLGLFLFQKNRTSKLKLNQEKLLLEQKVLRSQMNPHFIFNALTAIQKTIFDNDPLKSSAYLSKFSKLIRQNFEFINKKEITLEDDIDALKNYIETQQLRFEDKFEYYIDIEKTINTSLVHIPPMLLQPFVENAIEHGIRQKSTNGLLQIRIYQEQDYICFNITDNGVGYQKKGNLDNREHAIDVFLKRLRLRNYGEEKLFSIQPLEDNKGTMVIIKLYI